MKKATPTGKVYSAGAGVSTAFFSSRKTTWETPNAFFEYVHKEFRFDIDLSATESNSKLPNFYSPEQDALKQKWSGTCWLNPPYGDMPRWVGKAYASARAGATVVCLLPVKTAAHWWHDLVMRHAKEVRFIRGQIQFVGADLPAPFSSALVVFAPWDAGQTEPKFVSYDVPRIALGRAEHESMR